MYRTFDFGTEWSSKQFAATVLTEIRKKKRPPPLNEIQFADVNAAIDIISQGQISPIAQD